MSTIQLKKQSVLKKLMLTLCLVCFVYGTNTFAQSVDWSIYEKGKKVTFEIKQWPNPYYSNPEFPLLDEDEKEELIEEYKEGIAEGEIKPTVSYFSYYVTVCDIGKDAQMVELEASIGAQTYTSQMFCRNDSMFLTRNKYPLITEVEGKVTGYAIQGVQVIPLPLKVGDQLPYFEDIAVSTPTTEDFTVTREVLAGFENVPYFHETVWVDPVSKIETQKWTHSGVDCRAIYKNIDVGVRSVSQTFMYNRGNAYAVVSGEEEIEVLGKKHKALVIDAQSWGKYFTDKSYESLTEEVAAELEEEFKDAEEDSQEALVAMGYAEEGGYMLSYGRDYFVPGLGIVKKVGLDKYGGLQTETILISVE